MSPLGRRRSTSFLKAEYAFLPTCDFCRDGNDPESIG
jgi:hypothetical protein